MTLMSGGRLLVVPDKTKLFGEQLEETLKEEQVSVVTLPPSVLSTVRPGDLRSLRTVVTAGEACSRKLVERWEAGRSVLNAYGPTEATVCGGRKLRPRKRNGHGRV